MSVGVAGDDELGLGPEPLSGGRGLLSRRGTSPLADAPVAVVDARDADGPAGILNYWNIIAKWRWLIGGCVCVGVALGLLSTFTTTRVYRATSTIQIDLEPAKVLALKSQQQGVFDDGEKYYQTQYELLGSRSLAQRVAEKEDLADDEAFLNQWDPKRRSRRPQGPSDAADHAARTARAAAMIAGGLHIEPVRTSRIVKISYESPDPRVAAKIANAVATNFISWNLERRYDASSSARKFLEDRLEQTRKALEDSQRRGNDYAQRNQLVDLGSTTSADGRSTPTEPLAATDLQAVSAALAAATTARIEAEQRWRQAAALPDMSLPDVLANPSAQAIKASRDQAAADYQQNLRRFKPDYPSMLEAKAKIDALDQQLKAQANSVRDSLKAQYNMALNIERQMQDEVQRRKAALLETQGKRVEQDFIDTDVSTSRSLYDSMLATYKEIGIAGAVDENNISFVDRAEVPGAPFKPELKKNLSVSSTLGLAAGLLLAVLLEAFDLSMKVPEDVEKQLGLPVLGTIPIMKGDVLPAWALEDPKSKIAEGYYSVRAALQFATENGAPRSLLVTGSTPAEGKSTTALAIASSFARLGYRVLLIDADMRDPSLHKVLSRDNRVGLSNLLAGASEIRPALQPTSYRNLVFLSSGPLPPNPAELLGGSRMRSLLELSKEQFGLVVIDSPAVMGLADAPQLASVVEGVVMVVEAAKTKRELARGAIRRLRSSNARIVGAVMTKFDLTKAGYAYAHTYGYGYDYGRRPEKIVGRGFRFLGLGRPRAPL